MGKFTNTSRPFKFWTEKSELYFTWKRESLFCDDFKNMENFSFIFSPKKVASLIPWFVKSIFTFWVTLVFQFFKFSKSFLHKFPPVEFFYFLSHFSEIWIMLSYTYINMLNSRPFSWFDRISSRIVWNLWNFLVFFLHVYLVPCLVSPHT